MQANYKNSASWGQNWSYTGILLWEKYATQKKNEMNKKDPNFCVGRSPIKNLITLLKSQEQQMELARTQNNSFGTRRGNPVQGVSEKFGHFVFK